MNKEVRLALIQGNKKKKGVSMIKVINGISILLLAILYLLVAGCVRPAPQESKTESLQKMETALPGGALALCEKEWRDTLEKAKKEKIVTIATSGSAITAAAERISKPFTEKYGIEISWVIGRGAQLAEKLRMENVAGIYTTDLLLGGGNTAIMLKEKGLFQSLREALILPEVKDEAAWYGGKFPFLDKEEKYIFSVLNYPTQILHANTDMVPDYKTELASYHDLLKPKWKGKILSNDIVGTGGGLKWFSTMIEEDFGPILGLDYMKKLSQQELIINRDGRLSAEWLLRGKYPIGLNQDIDSILLSWSKEGFKVPIVAFTPKEGAYISTDAGNLSFLKQAPHPNAIKIFINWLLTKETQVIISKMNLKQSSRIDLPEPAQIDPRIIARDPDLKWPVADQEKYLIKTDEYIEMSRQIFGHLYQ